MKNIVGLYNEEKMLMCGAQFECAHNTANTDADTQAALRGKSNIFDVDFPIDGLRRLCIDPHSMSENAALEGTPLTLCPYYGVSLNLNVMPRREQHFELSSI